MNNSINALTSFSLGVMSKENGNLVEFVIPGESSPTIVYIDELIEMYIDAKKKLEALVEKKSEKKSNRKTSNEKKTEGKRGVEKSKEKGSGNTV